MQMCKHLKHNTSDKRCQKKMKRKNKKSPLPTEDWANTTDLGISETTNKTQTK